MEVKVSLHKKQGFAWHGNQGVSVKGFAFYAGALLQCNDLLNFILNNENWTDLLEQLNGSFSIIDNRESLIAVVDHIRSFPLSYAINNERLTLTDDANSLPKTNMVDDLAAEQLKARAWVMGADTLYTNIKEIPAGHFLSLSSNGGVVLTAYTDHLHTYELEQEQAVDYYPLLSQTSEHTFQRVVEFLNGRTAVIPLSGGFDSRYIVAMLKKLGYDKVICYSYGREDSVEAATSKQVAEQLGYPWHFIPYTKELLATFFTDEGEAYRAYASNLSALAHEQDWFAVKELKAKGLIPDDAVFLPGYTGDFLGGSYLVAPKDLKQYDMSITGLAEYIYHRLYSQFGDPDYKDRMVDIIKASLERQAVNNSDEFISTFEHWFTVNHIARFIVNAVRVYEFWGHQWYLPLWDRELANLWYSITNNYRKDKALYDAFLLNTLFEPMGISFQDKTRASSGSVVKHAKQLLPKAISKPLKKLYANPQVQDPNHLSQLADMFVERIQGPYKKPGSFSVNYPYACWYLQELSNK